MGNARKLLRLNQKSQKVEDVSKELKEETPPEPFTADDAFSIDEGTTLNFDSMPLFDPDLPHALVRGMKGIWYLQGKNYFNSKQEFVEEAPADQHLSMKIPEAAPLAVRRKEFLEQSLQELGRVRSIGRAPQAIINAERENAQAEAAERLAG